MAACHTFQWRGLPPLGRQVNQPGHARPRVHGKFLFVGDEKLYVKGVTYGAFEPDSAGHEYHDLEVIDRDFALMVESGINAVRIPHTMPPRSLLDAAENHGLKVMVGLSAEQYAGYLADRKDAPDLERVVRDKVAGVAGHPAILCYALGNEIQPPLARWLGRRTIERYLERLYEAVKDTDPGGLVTYVNYPTTEYLDLPFLDLLAFNVYLEKRDRLEAYLARLHSLAGDRPLLMSEVGLDALRNGEDVQANVLDWQIRQTFASGCAGAFVFSWTDEWFRAGEYVDDWAFGLTRPDREPKPALAAVTSAFEDVPFPAERDWPRVSVVVCTFNGGRTLGATLQGIERLEYPDLEVIVVDDGSTDDTAAVAAEFDVRLIRTPNAGLGAARNVGAAAATGEIVAYLDADAWPDPHWVHYLVDTFDRTGSAAVGGPNIPPPDANAVAESVAHSPGGPIHVLVSDTEAEHIPGCNFSIRKDVLEELGGFDPQFRAAGDDVDLCWRLQEAGHRISFNPAAMVWHHRRNSVRAYWRQQRGYGRAEALLERKWPHRYNAAGHVSWGGDMYGNAFARLGFRRSRIYNGVWGFAPFQSLYQGTPSVLDSLARLPEWYLVIGVLGVPVRARAVLGATGVRRSAARSGTAPAARRRPLQRPPDEVRPAPRARGLAAPRNHVVPACDPAARAARRPDRLRPHAVATAASCGHCSTQAARACGLARDVARAGGPAGGPRSPRSGERAWRYGPAARSTSGTRRSGAACSVPCGCSSQRKTTARERSTFVSASLRATHAPPRRLRSRCSGSRRWLRLRGMDRRRAASARYRQRFSAGACSNARLHRPLLSAAWPAVEKPEEAAMDVVLAQLAVDRAGAPLQASRASMRMTVVCLGADALDYPEGKGGGHTWVFLNWALGLRAAGCRVIWLESKPPRISVDVARERLAILTSFLEHHGFEEIALASSNGEPPARELSDQYLSSDDAAAEADLLLDLGHNRSPTEVERFSRTAFVDIDPGLLQLWMESGETSGADYDRYFTIGETVGTERARFPDGGLTWIYTPPPVFLEEWPVVAVGAGAAYTTVTHLYAGTVEIDGEEFNNDKRTAFLEYLDLPSRAHSAARTGSLPRDG